MKADVFVPHSLRSPFPPLSASPTPQRPLHVVLATTGSVASIKTPLIVERLLGHENVRVQVIATPSSLHFYNPQAIHDAVSPESTDSTVDSGSYTVQELAAEVSRAAESSSPSSADTGPRLHFWQDIDEWHSWKRIGDPILHIELRRWADVVLVAPCSANTLAKIHAGLCDDLLTSFLRALSPTTPTYLFPAMNTLMHMHPLTAVHVDFAKQALGYEVIGPIEKRLACGDLGQGAMQEWSDIVQIVVDRFHLIPALTKGNTDVRIG